METVSAKRVAIKACVAILLCVSIVFFPRTAFADEEEVAAGEHVTSVFVTAAAPTPAPDPKPIPAKTADNLANGLLLLLGISAAVCFITAFTKRKKEENGD